MSGSGSEEENIETSNTPLLSMDDKIVKKLNVGLFDKLLRQKQLILFDGYFRLNTNNMQIPQDIIALFYMFYEIHIALLLQIIKESGQCIPTLRNQTIHKMTEKDCTALARLLRDQKEYFVAHEMMSFLLKSNPKCAKLHSIMATILSRWSCYFSAENEYQLAIKLEPDNNAFKYNLGLLYEKEEKYDLALQMFLSASTNDPTEAEYLFESAYCFQMLKDFHNATLNYLKCMQMDANRAIYYEYYALYLCQEFSDLKLGQRYFEKSIELETNRWQVYYSYGRCLRDYFKDYEKSKEIYLKALELDSSKGFIYGSYGYLLYLNKLYDEAQIYLEIGIDLDPDRPFTHYYNSLLFRKINCKVKAEKYLLDAVSVTSIPKAVIRIVQRMKKENPADIEHHLKFEILLNAKVTAMDMKT